MQNAIAISNLRVRFGRQTVINNLSLAIPEGKFAAIVGVSGCGKTTLLHVISGVIPGMIPASLGGNVSVFGFTPLEVPPGTIDMMFQEDSLCDWRSARQNVALGEELLHGNTNPQKALDLLAAVGLADSRGKYPRELSGGMKKRVELASAILSEPSLLLLDEPLAKLDYLTMRTMWSLFERLRSEGKMKTVVLVTHNLDEAVVLSDLIFVMSPLGELMGTIEIESGRATIERRQINKPSVTVIKGDLARPRSQGYATSVDCTNVVNAIAAMMNGGGNEQLHG